MAELRSERVREAVLGAGFDAVGIARADALPDGDRFRTWLAKGYQGTMDWLARAPERRTDPGRVLAGVKSVVVVGVSYFVEEPPREIWDDPLRGRVARYAWGRDYHKVLTPGLKRVASELSSVSRAYVDTGPVLERAWAERAGLGFAGKNTLLISPRFGSYLLLGVIFTDAELEPDDATTPRGTCGACMRCQWACPTRAFPAPHVLDARRCISYLTIEHRGAIDPDLEAQMGNWVFGCDVCQEICPWVRQFRKPSEANRWLAFEAERCAPRLEELLGLDRDGFLARFAGTPVMRAKLSGLRRNAAIALGNSSRPEARDILARHEADLDPVVRDAVGRALSRLEAAGR